MCDVLGSAGVLTLGDTMALEMLCNEYAELMQDREAKRRPTAADRNSLRLMLGEFGLTPKTRAGIGAFGPAKEKNPFTELTGT